ncbi:MAG TPA: ABC transporter substrate-binding protein [Capsulimonadaceae bacterium]|jgi:ABC-type branched-subunit amino acid transport system substrate-binding protein
MNNITKSFVRSCVILLAGTIVLAGCQALHTDSTNTGTQKVAAILPLTGSLSFLGVPGKNALLMASEKIKSLGKTKIDVQLYDSKADPKEAVTVAQKATEIDGANFLITTLTGPSLAIKPVAQQKKALQEVVAIYPEVAKDSNFALQACYSADQEAATIVHRVISGNIKQIFVMYSLDQVSDLEVRKYIRPQLEQAHVRVEEQTFQVGNKDFRSQVLRLKQSGIRNVILLGYGSDFPAALKEMADQGILDNIHILGGIGYLELPDYVSYNLVKNAVFTSPEFNVNPTGSQLRKDFVDAYKKRFSANVVPYDAAYTYDALMLLADALDNSKDKSPTGVREYILSKGSFDGVTGHWAFTKEGNLISPMAIASFDPKMNIVAAK